MDDLAQSIADILHDYHKYNGFNFDAGHVIKWVSQFDKEDQVFILTEFLHLLNQGIYVSEEKGKLLLLSGLQGLAKKYNFQTVSDFLQNVVFLRLQPRNKSQHFLLNLLDVELNKKVAFGVDQCGKDSKKYAIYIDDIIASDNSVFKDLKNWLEIVNDDGETNFTKVINKSVVLIVSAFCIHTWQTIEFRLKRSFDDGDKIIGKILFYRHYGIENHRKGYNQKFNIAFPVDTNNEDVSNYIKNLREEAKYHADVVFRNPKQPKTEGFFSSPENRIRFENILLFKGIELLNKVNDLAASQRPMGMTNPTFRTLGTGTLFFTWRNISNTCPVVFWWKVDWYYLFELIGRG